MHVFDGKKLNFHFLNSLFSGIAVWWTQQRGAFVSLLTPASFQNSFENNAWIASTDSSYWNVKEWWEWEGVFLHKAKNKAVSQWRGRAMRTPARPKKRNLSSCNNKRASREGGSDTKIRSSQSGVHVDEKFTRLTSLFVLFFWIDFPRSTTVWEPHTGKKETKQRNAICHDRLGLASARHLIQCQWIDTETADERQPVF